MFSKPLAFALLAVGCITAAAGGAYVATRHNTADTRCCSAGPDHPGDAFGGPRGERSPARGGNGSASKPGHASPHAVGQGGERRGAGAGHAAAPSARSGTATAQRVAVGTHGGTAERFPAPDCIGATVDANADSPCDAPCRRASCRRCHDRCRCETGPTQTVRAPAGASAYAAVRRTCTAGLVRDWLAG